mmetsp:Transcript_47712/g.94161  ORF Transcript_47712/g.94161 Transcript_47712/m.94161 type:complete len:86 (-) Transcript_47712:183-440(-)
MCPWFAQSERRDGDGEALLKRGRQFSPHRCMQSCSQKRNNDSGMNVGRRETNGKGVRGRYKTSNDSEVESMKQQMNVLLMNLGRK